MSESQKKAMAYSAKCARRQQRIARRRNEVSGAVLRFCLPFSLGLLSMAIFVATLV